MKLKSLAALIFRILGGLLILDGVVSLLAALLEFHGASPVSDNLTTAVIGIFLMGYSKRLGALFCKDLDDDSA